MQLFMIAVMMVSLNSDFITEYSSQYDKKERSKLENELFEFIGPRTQQNGFYSPDDFFKV